MEDPVVVVGLERNVGRCHGHRTQRRLFVLHFHFSTSSIKFSSTFIARTLTHITLAMADLTALEQRFEGISVQDENTDSNALKQHKSKVYTTTPGTQQPRL
jgi:hypothetical protein